MMPPRPLLAVCLLLLGGLAWTVEGRPPPTVALADAARWEGQAVVVEGWAQAVTVANDGALRFALTDGPHAVATRVGAGSEPEGAAKVQGGERVAVAGRLLRSPAGDLQLLAEGAEALRRVAGPSVVEPEWAAVARDPAAWNGRPLRLTGEVDRGWLRGPGHAVQTGEGPWPTERRAAVAAEGFLRYDDACLCFDFDAVAVRPWTP